MRLNVALLCAAAALSCVKRVAPSAGEERTAMSGVPLQFGEAMELPEGTQILWDFGDGTQPQPGAQVTHAFPRAGTFTVTQTVKDRDGQQRSSTRHATILRRAVPMAVPGDARAALLFQSPWARLALHRETAAKLGLGGFFDGVGQSLSAGVGFDVFDPQALAQNGFDPDEGVAFYTLPQDPEALVAVIGTSDDERSLAAVRRLLSQERVVGRTAIGPFELQQTQLTGGVPLLVGTARDGLKVGVLQRYGYLYFRTPGLSDPLASLATAAALPPDRGLYVDPRYLAALKHVGTGDAVFYSRPPESGETEAANRFAGELGASSFAVTDSAQLLDVRFFSQLRNVSGPALQAALTPERPPSDLAARLAPGAAGYLRLSASPQALWRELTRASGADAARLRDRVQETMGLDLERDLIPSFTGNLGLAVYLDARSLIEAMLGEQVGSFDRSAFVAVGELSHPEIVRAALERAMKSRPATDTAELPGGARWYRLGDAAQAAMQDQLLFLSVGGQAPRLEAPPPAGRRKGKPPPPRTLTAAELGPLGEALLMAKGARSLSQVLGREGVRGFEVAGLQSAWADVAGVVGAVEKAAAERGGLASSAAEVLATRAAQLRDALLQAHATPEGLEAELFVRFRAAAK